MKNIAVFVSGGGSNFMAIHHQIQKREIPGEIVLVISNNPNCGAIEYANENSISHVIINETRNSNPHTRCDLMTDTCLKAKINLICLAGYMKMLPPAFVKQYENKILNIHPGLLPEFGGKGFFIKDPKDLAGALKEAKAFDGPALVNVVLHPEAGRKPQQFGWLTT